MYIPEHFSISNDEQVDRFIKANAFGQLIATLDGKLVATHMPFLFQSREQALLGHIAKANPQWRPEYEAAMLAGIIGIEINIHEIQCKFKLSQNRDRLERKSVSERLRAEGEIGLAVAMENEPDIN